MHLPNPVTEATERRGKPAKFSGIAASLRREILGGKFSVGDRLPSWDEIAERFDTTKVTVKKAIDVLAEDGLLEARMGAGTFVTGPAQASLLPVVLAISTGSVPGRSRFLEALEREAQRLAREGRNLSVYRDSANRHQDARFSTIARLTLEHRVRGIVFAPDAFPLMGTPLCDEPHIPRVRIGSGGVDGIPGIGFGAQPAMAEMAMAHFAQQGRRRVALIRHAHYEGELADDPFPRIAARHGLTTRPEWILGASAFQAPDTAEPIARLLAMGQGENRPDALLIADDNLVPYATRGMKAAGVRGGEDMDIVAHANFPCPTECHVPARRIGNDVGAILELALEVIEAQREGRKIERRTVPVRWEEQPSLVATAAVHG